MQDNFPSSDSWLPHRVSYGETDAMNVVYYAEYFHLFERSRNTWLRERGMSYKEIEAQGVFLPVREAACRYRSPLRYDDLVHIRVGVQEWGRASILFVYQIYNETKDKILASGSTQHACVNAAGKPVPTPSWLSALASASTLR